MLAAISRTVLICVGVIVVSGCVTEAAQAEESEYVQEYGEPQAEERTFKGGKGQKLAPLIEKKNWFLSFFTRSHQPEPPTVHTLAPLEQYPIWKVHKYKGIELRPVQVVDLPTAYSAEPETVVSLSQPAEPLRAPHTEYGTPAEEYGPPNVGDYSFNNQPVSGELFPPIKEEPIHQLEVLAVAPQPTLQEIHAEKLRTILGALKSHKNFLKKLKNLKRLKLGLKQSASHVLQPPAVTYALPKLPEVADIPLKGLENLDLQVPELPAINLPSYTSTVSAGPYVRVQYGTPLPVVNYGVPVSSYPVYHSVQTYQPQVPAPYYGAPPLFDSYGTPLPSDFYSSAASEQVPAIALPDIQPQTPATSHHEVKESSGTTANDVPAEPELGFVKQANNTMLSTEKQNYLKSSTSN